MQSITTKKSQVYLATVAALSIFVFSCSTPSAINKNILDVSAPDNWQRTADNQIENESTPTVLIEPVPWLDSFNDKTLTTLVDKALQHNRQLAIQAYNVELAKQKVTVASSTDYPDLTLSINQSRNKTVDDSTSQFNNSANLTAQLKYEIDIWGKLSDEQKKQRLLLASEQANFQHQRLSLVAELSTNWFDLKSAKSLLALFNERAVNQERNLDIIKAAYNLGINDALDVYLAQNDVNRDLARVKQQEQIVLVSTRKLELLLSEYPSGQLLIEDQTLDMPSIDQNMPVGIPSDLLTKRQDIQASWFDLMAADASVAVAHKQRFPQIALSASTGDSSDELHNLLDSSSLAWSLLGNITTPLFNAGRLAAIEEQARIAVKQKEQQYLTTVFNAFSEVENYLSNETALQQQLAFYIQAQENALAAQSLSFSQYLKGLVAYATVLEAQRRAFEAQASVIQLSNDQVQNRLKLYVALGESFDSTAPIQNKNLQEQ